MKRIVLVVGMAGMCCTAAMAAGAPAAGPDEAGVRAAENLWNKAFMTGDIGTLDQLLDPAYVSVGANGAARSKADVIALGRRFAAAHPNATVPALPPTSIISVKGNAAVVTHHAPEETSVDMFYYSQGYWHAWYSQHTHIAKAS